MVTNFSSTFLSERNLYKVVKQLLSDEGIRLKKKLSQTFLIDREELEYISNKVKESAPNYCCVVEVGAGIGNLTSYVAALNSDKIVIAIEVDKRFAKILKALQEEFPNIDIVIGDALKIIPSMRGCSIVIGNLPYHITSSLLVTIAKSSFDLALITVQKEVAERIVSKAGDKSYGKITVFLQHLFEVNYIKTIPQYKFYPKPCVDSAVILLKRKKSYDTIAQLLEHLIKCLFSFRRKTVGKAIKNCLKGFRISELYRFQEIWKKRVYQLSVEELEKIAYIIANQKTRK
ncbi:MAG: 16S rRNA (adenine(1518)-N(6)/adenine(1519)-N(6))-dimethyltransferase RsmA [Ignisphaera sp.]|jgi:16S rRNA (adenine1518-N6/adenine1519-N6)-dimethyltransferase|nr:16S rRNA (adenine(1518)-N(6)/adenine(1519)-N(6))-dimethyltransferase RsmA [Ignisphaera sp.]MCC6055550.1 16S rRNA (adenine(1518)-N(6)/adenine(1519)-N(6))-dimethyltransferase RsmA [Desulfurococcaceae archaeon]